MSATINHELFFDVQQKTDKQHILDNPDTYIGSVECVDSKMWVMDDLGDKIIEKTINYIPGLYKLFDEGIVNCRDHAIRMQNKVTEKMENALPVTHIDINIEHDGTITMINDGNGIDVAKKDNVWIPELVFGHLRTSTNYNKEEKKIVGGKNGFGFKLVLIWSSYGRIETVDHIRGLKYTQVYNNNLDEICEPIISKCKNKPYTKIIFRPDYKRLGIDNLTPEIISLLKKRAYDIAALTDKGIKVKYNDKIIPVKNFDQYINMYIGDKSTTPRIYECGGERWEYAVALNPHMDFVQISFVNGIHTAKGGKHVEYIVNQITRKLADLIEKKKKIKVSSSSIKSQIILFLRCDIENPSFDSQTKDCMNTPPSKFGSKCEISDIFVEKIAKMGVMNSALQLTEIKDIKDAKKTDGTKTKTIRGIPKLIDANWAGTEKSNMCTLFLVEGDSAKSGLVSGLSSDDRNTCGVYALKGKLLNVRGETLNRISDNKEITEIKKILGLNNGEQYTDIMDVYKKLRYGRLLFLTDQDLDGSHIKGLVVNLFFCEWPSLTQIPGFIGFMNTPILKAKKGKQELNFYNNGEFDEWKEQNDVNDWKIKYYKGLGTSTAKEFKEYVANQKIVAFEDNDKTSNDIIDMIFNKKRADDRKLWLGNYDRNSFVDTGKKIISYAEFVNKEFIHFSKYDCDRSIPNLMDGMKISQRKILFAAFKRNLTTEIKVAQFSGYVSEHSGYHHGEASLNSTIVGMAQNFIGSNNINLFCPNGQFGTRIQGGKDSASERYIFTLLNKITRTIFQIDDDNILKYLNDDGLAVEPIYYAPIVPMILINGSKGIGTGFSTDIMCYNPLQIIEYLENKLNDVINYIDFIPYYEGFNGQISKVGEKFLIKGVYTKIATDKIKVTELPIGFWTQDFKELLEELIKPADRVSKKMSSDENNEDLSGKKKHGKTDMIEIKDYEDISKDTNVDFTITFAKGRLDELEKQICEYGCNGVEKILKLYTTNTITNMHLFDSRDLLRKFEKVTDIIDVYYDERIKLYQMRKNSMIDVIEKELIKLRNKARYIKEIIDGTIDLRKKTQIQIIDLLLSKEYNSIDDDVNYNYLIKMPMDSVSEENVDKLYKTCNNKEVELVTIKETSINKMWLNDLTKIKEQYIEYKIERTNMEQLGNKKDNMTTKPTIKKSHKK